MKTRGAVITQSPGKWEILELELDAPRQGELILKMVASGLCHSDDHMTTGDLQPGTLPTAGGHEGAGIVHEVGPNTPGWEIGDHVVLSFLPGCGRCRWCGVAGVPRPVLARLATAPTAIQLEADIVAGGEILLEFGAG